MAKKKKLVEDGPSMQDRILEWSGKHDNCAVCFIHYTVAYLERFPQPLQRHHIVGGTSKFDHEANWLKLCSLCHDHYHSGGKRFREGERLPDLVLGHILWSKRDVDPDSWDPELLKAKRGRGLPDLIPLPVEFLRERERHGPYNPAG
jgi:hypothetical protein